MLGFIIAFSLILAQCSGSKGAGGGRGKSAPTQRARAILHPCEAAGEEWVFDKENNKCKKVSEVAFEQICTNQGEGWTWDAEELICKGSSEVWDDNTICEKIGAKSNGGNCILSGSSGLFRDICLGLVRNSIHDPGDEGAEERCNIKAHSIDLGKTCLALASSATFNKEQKC